MNNLQLIEKVLYYIDEYIYEELTYERLAVGVRVLLPCVSARFCRQVTELSITRVYPKAPSHNGT